MINLRKRGRPRAAGQERSTPRIAKRIDVKLPPAIFERVEALVKQGLYMSMSDFGRAAVREKIVALGLADKD